MALVKLQVRVSRRDAQDPDKEITNFEDYLVNPEAVDAVIQVPGTDTCVVKLRNGDSILTKSSLAKMMELTK
jgi:hypothetical protein